jgi:hypothetical protein
VAGEPEPGGALPSHAASAVHSGRSGEHGTKPYRSWPPLRSDAFSPDEGDQRRVEWAWRLWKSQDLLLASRDRQIEENIRMIAGRQWSVWSRLLGRFIDVNELLSQSERLWRQRPVFNHLLDWFLLSHARLTENPPIITFQPSTPDRSDSEVAEIMDVIKKSLWEDVGMLEVVDRLVQILIPSGSAHLISRVDPMQGEVVEFRGPAVVPDLLDQQVVVRGWYRRTPGPVLELRSDPPLDQADILALVAFGRPIAGLDQREQMSLQQAAVDLTADYAAGIVGRAVSDALGLEHLGIDVGEINFSGGEIHFGRYVGERTFVTLSQEVTGRRGREVAVEYRLSREWRVGVSSDTEGRNAIDVIWNRRY